MFSIQRIASSGIVLAVIGQLQADDVGELSALLAEEAVGQALALDLKDLVLVKRRAVRFLQECETQGIALHHCSSYIRVWISAKRFHRD